MKAVNPDITDTVTNTWFFDLKIAALSAIDFIRVIGISSSIPVEIVYTGVEKNIDTRHNRSLNLPGKSNPRWLRYIQHSSPNASSNSTNKSPESRQIPRCSEFLYSKPNPPHRPRPSHHLPPTPFHLQPSPLPKTLLPPCRPNSRHRILSRTSRSTALYR